MVSPGVLARPAIQDAVLGTTIQLVGPGELAYMAQAAVTHAVLEVEPTVVAALRARLAAGSLTAEDALEIMEVSPVDILLTDLRLPGTSGIELLKTVSGLYPDVAVIMLTQYGSIDSAVAATRLGAGR